MKHRADRSPRFSPLAAYRPRHCSGVTPSGGGCLHQHNDERRCHCGQVILNATVQTITNAVQSFVVPTGKTKSEAGRPVRHSLKFCHVVSPASQALMKAGA